MQNAFERYGGFAAISKIVMAFYDKILDCDQIGHFFDDVEMPRLVDHQTKFIATVMGGPTSYSDEALRRMHRHLEISQHDFDRMRTLLRETLIEFKIEPRDVDTVMDEIGKRESVIVKPGLS